jgi:hypothetical protein
METLEVTAKTYNKGQSGAGVIVWAKNIPVDRLIPPVGIMEPDECFPEYRFAVRLADGSDIFLSHEQAQVISEAYGKVEAGVV